MLNSEEIDDDDEEDSTPHKNMQAIGHIGALSVRADSVKNRTEHGGSSIGMSRRSNSLARNMNSFLMSRQGPNQSSKATKSLIGGNSSSFPSYRPPSIHSQFNDLSDTERDHLAGNGGTASRTDNISELDVTISDPGMSHKGGQYSAM